MNLQWYNLLLTSIPEAIAMMMVGLSFINVQLKKQVNKIILFSILYGSFVFILWQLHPYQELRVIINITIFLLLALGIFRLHIIPTFIITLISVVALVVFEFIALLTLHLITGDVMPLLEIPHVRVVLSYSYLIPLAMFAIFLSNSKFRLKETTLKGKKMYIFVMLCIGLFQIITLLYFVNLITFLNVNGENIFSFNGIPIYILLIMVFSIIPFILIRNWFREDTKKAISFTEETYHEQFHSLVASIRSQQHDMSNHLMIINGLIQNQDYGSAQKYMNTLIKEVQISNTSIGIKYPVLSVLLYSKAMTAQTKMIQFQFTIQSIDIVTKVSDTDLIRILSNLIDNAFEATLYLPEAERKVSLTMKQQQGEYIVDIHNTGKPIEQASLIFHSGFSTKRKSNKASERGFGLTITYEVTKKYNGSLNYEYKDQLHQFLVKIPV